MPTAFQLYLQTVREREAQPYSKGGGAQRAAPMLPGSAAAAAALSALTCLTLKKYDAVFD